MQLANGSSHYGLISQGLHWLTVGLVIVLLITGKFGDIEADQPGNALFLWHGSLGVLVLLLVIARMLWAFASPAPALPSTMSRVGRVSARTMHVCLYALLVALPLSGWLAASAQGASVNFFGFASIPRWDLRSTSPPVPSVEDEKTSAKAPGEERDEFFEELHEVLGNALLILASLHALIALKHHFIDRDEVLKRMLPWSAPATRPATAPPTREHGSS